MSTPSTNLPPGYPLWCGEFELSGVDGPRGVVEPLATDVAARILVRLHGQTLGYLQFDAPPVTLTAQDVRARAFREYGDQITEHLTAESLSQDGSAPVPAASTSCPMRVVPETFVSLVVCTRDRSEILKGCLDHLRALTYPNLEIIVVDNAPTSDATRALVEEAITADTRFRYVLEPKPGLAAARNAGLAAAKGTILAYTDDDVSVDPNWIDALVRGFSSYENVGCVTGIVCSASIATSAEAYFDARLPSWSSRSAAEVFDLGEHRRSDLLYPYSAGIFGTGANFAFDREFLEHIGGFDDLLGAGTPTKGGEDLDIFVRILRGGMKIVYWPDAVVWHHHRTGDAELLKQMYGYGTGMTAYVTKLLLNRDTRRDVLRRIPAGVRRLARIKGQTDSRLGEAKAPAGAARREFRGYVDGPWLYLKSRRAATRQARNRLADGA